MAHAAFHFWDEHPAEAKAWLDDSNFIVVVAVPDEDTLLDYADIAVRDHIPYSLVIEPDLGGEHTALALAAGPASRRVCASLPLALREVVTSS